MKVQLKQLLKMDYKLIYFLVGVVLNGGLIIWVLITDFDLLLILALSTLVGLFLLGFIRTYHRLTKFISSNDGNRVYGQIIDVTKMGRELKLKLIYVIDGTIYKEDLKVPKNKKTNKLINESEVELLYDVNNPRHILLKTLITS